MPLTVGRIQCLLLASLAAIWTSQAWCGIRYAGSSVLLYQPAAFRPPAKAYRRPELPQAHIPVPAALQFAQALQHLLKDASSAHHLHRVACLRIVRTLLADVLASVLFTTLGYTVEEADQVVEEHIAPVLATYLASHGPHLARARGHEPASQARRLA